jgi:hypothetical protein
MRATLVGISKSQEMALKDATADRSEAVGRILKCASGKECSYQIHMRGRTQFQETWGSYVSCAGLKFTPEIERKKNFVDGKFNEKVNCTIAAMSVSRIDDSI